MASRLDVTSEPIIITITTVTQVILIFSYYIVYRRLNKTRSSALNNDWQAVFGLYWDNLICGHSSPANAGQ